MHDKKVVGSLWFLGGVLLIPVTALLYLTFGGPPVAVTDPALPFEKQRVHLPLETRVQREIQRDVPPAATRESRGAGAAVYHQNCASCHGLPDHPSTDAQPMYLSAPQLWRPDGKGVVAVNDDLAGETLWRVEDGIRLTAMPAYADLLLHDAMRQVTLLLSSADRLLSSQIQEQLKP